MINEICSLSNNRPCIATICIHSLRLLAGISQFFNSIPVFFGLHFENINNDFFLLMMMNYGVWQVLWAPQVSLCNGYGYIHCGLLCGSLIYSTDYRDCEYIHCYRNHWVDYGMCCLSKGVMYMFWLGMSCTGAYCWGHI